MVTHHIAVWEWDPYWVPELQRAWGSLEGRVSPCRIPRDVTCRLDEGARQLVIALPAEDQLPLQAIEQWIRRGVRVHVVLPEKRSSCRWFLCELGVASVFNFVEARAHLIQVCRDAVLTNFH